MAGQRTKLDQRLTVSFTCSVLPSSLMIFTYLYVIGLFQIVKEKNKHGLMCSMFSLESKYIGAVFLIFRKIAVCKSSMILKQLNGCREFCMPAKSLAWKPHVSNVIFCKFKKQQPLTTTQFSNISIRPKRDLS